MAVKKEKQNSITPGSENQVRESQLIVIRPSSPAQTDLSGYKIE